MRLKNAGALQPLFVRANVVADFVDPPGPLGDGYRVEARIIIWEAESVLKVPSSALFRHGDGWSVFVVENGRAMRREVEIGHRSQFEAEVLSGLDEGVPVIVHPTNQIGDRAKVEGGSANAPAAVRAFPATLGSYSRRRAK